MNVKNKKPAGLEVSSDQISQHLEEIKERVGALETIASLANRKVVEEFVRPLLKSERAKQIMRECREPRTREELEKKLGLNSPQALNHHLAPLRQDDLLHQSLDPSGIQTFEWSNLFKRLPNRS